MILGERAKEPPNPQQSQGVAGLGITRWWQLKYFFMFTPKIGEDFEFDEHIFQRGWFNHQPDYLKFLNKNIPDGWI